MRSVSLDGRDRVVTLTERGRSLLEGHRRDRDDERHQEFRAGISLPNGFEYTYAEMGSGTTSARAGLAFELKDSYGQFHELHMNQDGVIR